VIRYPYPGGAIKHRKGLEKEDGERKFWWSPPTQAGQVPFLPPDFERKSTVILLEGETDTMAAWQALPEEHRAKVAIVGLSGTNAWKTRYSEELMGEAKRVFVVFDRDDPYETPKAAEATEAAWSKIRADLGRKARRVTLPQGINDVAEFFQRYDWAAFQTLLKAAAEPKRTYPRLDLTQEIPPTDWLIEDLLVGSEATVLSADSGVGKSFFSMAAALAVSGGDETFLGLPIHRHGPVLYVDEENSAQLVLARLHALGFDPAKHSSLEYLWYAGVDLVGEPSRLLEEALDLEPALVVLDSLSRVGMGVDENSNTDMTKLLRQGIVPLARETGAAVLVLHHTPKDGTGSRGAGAIKAAVDQELSLVPAKSKDSEGSYPTGTLNLFPSKPRRKGATLKLNIVGDVEAGNVRVVSQTEREAF
jgi:hypothetical protein